MRTANDNRKGDAAPLTLEIQKVIYWARHGNTLQHFEVYFTPLVGGGAVLEIMGITGKGDDPALRLWEVFDSEATANDAYVELKTQIEKDVAIFKLRRAI